MSSAAYHEWADQAALLVVRNLPQALFVVLVAVVLGLILKDALNGATRRTFLNPDKWQPLTLVGARGGCCWWAWVLGLGAGGVALHMCVEIDPLHAVPLVRPGWKRPALQWCRGVPTGPLCRVS